MTDFEQSASFSDSKSQMFGDGDAETAANKDYTSEKICIGLAEGPPKNPPAGKYITEATRACVETLQATSWLIVAIA